MEIGKKFQMMVKMMRSKFKKNQKKQRKIHRKKEQQGVKENELLI